MTFIKKFSIAKVKAVCFTTSDIDRKYSKKFKTILENLGYDVIYHFDAVRGKVKNENLIRIKKLIGNLKEVTLAL